jgi:hypothetical protein
LLWGLKYSALLSGQSLLGQFQSLMIYWDLRVEELTASLERELSQIDWLVLPIEKWQLSRSCLVGAVFIGSFYFKVNFKIILDNLTYRY